MPPRPRLKKKKTEHNHSLNKKCKSHTRKLLSKCYSKSKLAKQADQALFVETRDFAADDR